MPHTGPSSVDAVCLHDGDNICVAARNLAAGARVEVRGRTVMLSGAVEMGHKIAIAPVADGEPIYKYGQPIGLATRAIRPGDLVHEHNLSDADFHPDYAPASRIPPDPEPIADRTFMGYRRPSGKAGTRNYVAVISTVNCSASVSKFVARHFDRSAPADYPNIDGVIAFTHHTGCGMQFGGAKHEMLNRVLGGIARHPNIGAYLLIGLGCEQCEIDGLIRQQQLVPVAGATATHGGQSPPALAIQDLGGTTRTVEKAIEMVAALLPRAADVRREPISAGELILGTECGASDGASGITANPALGAAADMVVACGGTVILSETSEIYGAEHLLTRRAKTAEVADKLIERVKWWERYAGMYGVRLAGNPSVGNRKGGLTTIAEKSLGAVAKAGSTALVDVYQYAEPVTARGLVFMDSPGDDPVSVAGMAAGGANVIAFTTGRGSCFGGRPAPSLKIASNTPMFERMRGDMDIDAGSILAGRGIEDVGREIFEAILATAGGEKTKSEQLGIGDEEFVPWTVGPTL